MTTAKRNHEPRSAAQLLPTTTELRTNGHGNGSMRLESETGPAAQAVQRQALRTDRLIKRMRALFGDEMWRREYGSATAMDEWSMAIADLTDHQVAAGLGVLREAARQWPPSVPAFRAMCIGDTRAAIWAEVMAYIDRDQWFTLPAAYHIADQIGFAEIRKLTMTRLESAFNRIFRAMDPNDLPEIPRRIGRAHQLDAPQPTSHEAAKAKIAAMREALGITA